MKAPLFLQAFEGTNAQVPVWFMRQAGRYLPEYQQIRQQYPLEKMFTTPELAAKITCMPVDILNVDAAILFADILTLPTAMGATIRFDDKKGPLVTAIKDESDIRRLHDIEGLDFLERTINLVNAQLPQHIPLIGFAGSPFTVLTYLLEGGSSASFTKTFKFIEENPILYHQLMDLLTKNTIRYFDLQKKSGIKVFQLFDTWVGILRPADYARWVLPYVQRIFEHIDIPSIYYGKNAGHLLSLMDKTAADFLSVCHTVILGHHATLEHTRKGIQGNLFNGLLYADDRTLAKEVTDVLLGGAKHKKFIFNLSHGVFPDTDVNKLKLIVEQVHRFKWSS